MFTARALHKSYAAGVTGCSASARVLAGLDLELHPGDVVGVTGPRACGKTTLLRCVAGLTRPDRGALHWADDARRPRTVAVAPAAYPFETVHDVIARACADPRIDPAILAATVAALSLDVVLGTAQFNLTTCERARLALAIGLAGVEPLLVVDGTIDAIGAAWRPAVRLLFAARAETGGAILAAGRDTDALAAVVARIFTLHAGRLVPDAAAGAALPAASVVRVAEPVPARGSPLH